MGILLVPVVHAFCMTCTEIMWRSEAVSDRQFVSPPELLDGFEWKLVWSLCHWSLPLAGSYILLSKRYLRSKENALFWDHVHPSICDLVSATKPFIGSSWNLLQKIVTNFVEQAWILWKSTQWNSYFTSWREWILNRIRLKWLSCNDNE